MDEKHTAMSKKDKSIQLHPKFGVNPTIPTCFWCGNSKNEVALLGAAFKGEAPAKLCIGYEPCDECEKNMAKGVTFMEASHKPAHDNQHPIQPNVYPTSRWVVVKEEAIGRIINNEAMAADIIKSGKAFLDVEAFTNLFVPQEEEGK